MLWFGTFVNRAGQFIVPFLSLYLVSVGHSIAEAGLVAAHYGAGTVVAGFMGGLLADRWGRKKTMVMSLIAGATAMVLLGGANALAAIKLLAFAVGLSGDMHRPAMQAMVADIVAPEHRQRAFAYLYWVINLGFAIAPALAGVIALTSYRLLFWGDAATTLLCAALIVWFVPESRPERARGAAAKPSIWLVLQDTRFMLFALAMACVSTVMWANAVGLPTDMTRKGMSEATYGVVIGFNGVMIIFSQPLVSRLVARVARRTLVTGSTVLLGCGYGLYAWAQTPASYLGAIAIWTLGEVASFPAMSTMVANRAPADLRGRYQGVYSLSWGVGCLLGPWLSGQVISRAGHEMLWTGALGLALSAAAMFWIALGRFAEGAMPDGSV